FVCSWYHGKEVMCFQAGWIESSTKCFQASSLIFIHSTNAHAASLFLLCEGITNVDPPSPTLSPSGMEVALHLPACSGNIFLSSRAPKLPIGNEATFPWFTNCLPASSYRIEICGAQPI